ncbi:uncharacterized protein LOC106647566 [Copidosoma floridanum]|uniref:uncharacterized protein LOC106647566 n=1 Tax=Copidosoma floridanum TaxID=29053 RepID=UPI0006C997C8|nr:uncharacterized protein LOC106647566 [Copidosoma floridanum]
MSSDDSSDSEFDEETVVRNLEEEAKTIVNGLLPQKSRALYEKAHAQYMDWKTKNEASFDKSSFLVYFEELSKKFKPPSLWSHWARLKATLNIKNNIKIEKYLLLKTILKNKSKGYKPKKSLILTWPQITEFLNSAEDSIYLLMKVFNMTIIIFLFALFISYL